MDFTFDAEDRAREFKFLETEALSQYMTHEEMAYYFNRLKHYRITEEKGFIREPTYIKNREFTRKGSMGITETKMVFGKEYTRSETVPCSYYKVPHHYEMKEAIREIMLMHMMRKFPWLSEFSFSWYGLDSGLPEIYVKVTCPENWPWKKDPEKTAYSSIYVPIDALFSGNIEAAKERHTSYFTWYRGSSSYSLNKKQGETFEQFEERKAFEVSCELSLLDSSEAKLFFDCMAGNCPFKEIPAAHDRSILFRKYA